MCCQLCSLYVRLLPKGYFARDPVASVRWRNLLYLCMRNPLPAHQWVLCCLLQGEDGCLPGVWDEFHSGVFWSHWWVRKDGRCFWTHQENFSDKEMGRKAHTDDQCWALNMPPSPDPQRPALCSSTYDVSTYPRMFLVRDWCFVPRFTPLRPQVRYDSSQAALGLKPMDC